MYFILPLNCNFGNLQHTFTVLHTKIKQRYNLRQPLKKNKQQRQNRATGLRSTKAVTITILPSTSEG